MSTLEKIAGFMQDHQLILVTAESCTAGLIAATLADVEGAGQLLDCAFVTYSPQSKQLCLSVQSDTLERYNLTSEAVAREMATGALKASSMANVAISNTGVTDDTDPDIAPGTQCYAWAFQPSDHHADLALFSETQQFSGDRNAIRQASALYALERLSWYFRRWTEGVV